jgi:hypothetical protein
MSNTYVVSSGPRYYIKSSYQDLDGKVNTPLRGITRDAAVTGASVGRRVVLAASERALEHFQGPPFSGGHVSCQEPR